MPQPEPMTIYIDGPNGLAKSHLAERLQDILLHFGYLVQPDPNHGFVTPVAMRTSVADMPPIYIVEYDEAVEQEIETTEQAMKQ